jgi:hypothetical protein
MLMTKEELNFHRTKDSGGTQKKTHLSNPSLPFNLPISIIPEPMNHQSCTEILNLGEP